MIAGRGGEVLAGGPPVGAGLGRCRTAVRLNVFVVIVVLAAVHYLGLSDQTSAPVKARTVPPAAPGAPGPPQSSATSGRRAAGPVSGASSARPAVELPVPRSGRVSVWMLDPMDWRGVLEVDPGTNRVVQRIDTGDAAGVVATSDAIWVSSGAAGTLKRLDRRARIRPAVVRVGGSPESMRLFHGRLWVLDTQGRLLALDASTGRVLMTVALREQVGSLTDDGRRLWVAASPGRHLLAVDPRTGQVTRHRYRGGADPTALAFDGRRLWVGNDRENTVTAVDPRTGNALQTIRLGPRDPTSWVPVPTWIEVVRGRPWVGHVVRVTGDGWRASVIDPTTGRRLATRWVPAGSTELATDGHAVWIQSGSSVARVDLTTGSFDVTQRSAPT